MAGKVFNVSISGWPKVKKILKETGYRGRAALAAELYQEAENVIGDSKANYVPVASGNLRATGYVRVPTIGFVTGGVLVEAGFGGTAAKYAEAVHENPRAGKTGGVSPSGKQYQRTRGGKPTWSQVGEWKYLETPFNTALKGTEGRVARGLKRRVKEFQ